ncbi:MAG TPA: methyl-accepting chemotaxis protein [Oscillospiraceae bacterium]|nr:methyl-accepting chemotaxis protein [Oscillospiraceae bacterium]
MAEKEQKKINKGILIGWTVISLVLLAAYFVELLKGARTIQYYLIFALLDVLPLIYGHIRYQKNKAYKYIKVICAVGYTALYAFALLTSTVVIDFAYVLPMMCVFVLCNDSKLIGLFGLSSIIINIIFVVMNAVKGDFFSNLSSYEVQMAAIILCSVFAYISTRISTQLNNDRIMEKMGTLNKVQEVEETVKVTTTDISAKLEELTDSFTQTMTAMKKTVAGSSNTSKAFQTQLSIAGDMQKVFNQTNELEQGMTKMMDQAVETVNTSEGNMKILEESAKQVDQSSSQVVSKMSELLSAADQVKKIVGVISEIASKTNLLALNASIEASRAGESGLGFSVVASEITDLARQTKEATENISSIITTLRDHADETSKVANEMAELNKKQNYYIENTNTNFKDISSAVDAIKGNIEKLNGQMSYFTTAINSNIESINMVSTISAETMGDANRTYEDTNRNGDVVKHVSHLAKNLMSSVNQLELSMKE